MTKRSESSVSELPTRRKPVASPEVAAKRAEERRRAEAYANSLTDEEDARITAAALADPDAQPLTEKFWANALPYDAHQERVRKLRGQRGPQTSPVKKLVSLRIDADVIEHFRATGPGWQSRINALLRNAAKLG